MSIFANVEPGSPIEIFALQKAYNEDSNEKKVNLGIGAYRTNEGKPWVLPVVREVEKEIANDDSLNHEYLPQAGSPDLVKESVAFLLGRDNKLINEGKTFGIQCLSGTGAIRTGAEFLRRHCGFDSVYISTPSWPNHVLIFERAGYSNIQTYRYWDGKNRKLDFDGLVEDLKKAKPKSIVILHSCAHNPTGSDPSEEEWKKIAELCKEKQLFPFFDSAYQGFASGDLVKDSWSVRYFAEQGFELFCAQSFSKNFGLYNERVGNLTVVVKDASTINNMKAQFDLIVRADYSNPPVHGARIVQRVLSNENLFKQWQGHVVEMSSRMKNMRKLLREELERLQTPGTWNHITEQIGMFSYTGLNANQCKVLVEKYHIYLPKSGRISMCGINTNNVNYVAQAFNDVVKEVN